MNELLLLSKEYIEKDDFTSEINISNHHFELGGWSEAKVVAVFSVLTAVFCLIAYRGL